MYVYIYIHIYRYMYICIFVCFFVFSGFGVWLGLGDSGMPEPCWRGFRADLGVVRASRVPGMSLHGT